MLDLSSVPHKSLTVGVFQPILSFPLKLGDFYCLDAILEGGQEPCLFTAEEGSPGSPLGHTGGEGYVITEGRAESPCSLPGPRNHPGQQGQWECLLDPL